MHNDVFRFDIAVDDLGSMQLIDSSANLLHDACYLDFRKRLATLELLEELSAHCYFQDDIDVLLVIETAIKFDDVWVI